MHVRRPGQTAGMWGPLIRSAILEGIRLLSWGCIWNTQLILIGMNSEMVTGVPCASPALHPCTLGTVSVYNHLHTHSQSFICVTEERTELRMAEVRAMSQHKHQSYTRMTILCRSNICLNFFLLESGLMTQSGQSQDMIISVYCVLHCPYFRI